MVKFVTTDDIRKFDPVMVEVCRIYKEVLELGKDDGVEYMVAVVPPEGALQIVVRQTPPQ